MPLEAVPLPTACVTVPGSVRGASFARSADSMHEYGRVQHVGPCDMPHHVDGVGNSANHVRRLCRRSLPSFGTKTYTPKPDARRMLRTTSRTTCIWSARGSKGAQGAWIGAEEGREGGCQCTRCNASAYRYGAAGSDTPNPRYSPRASCPLAQQALDLHALRGTRTANPSPMARTTAASVQLRASAASTMART